MYQFYWVRSCCERVSTQAQSLWTNRKKLECTQMCRGQVFLLMGIFSPQQLGHLGQLVVAAAYLRKVPKIRSFFLSLRPPGQLSFKEAHLVLFMLLLLILLLLQYNHFEMVLTLNTSRIILLRKAINPIYWNCSVKPLVQRAFSKIKRYPSNLRVF